MSLEMITLKHFTEQVEDLLMKRHGVTINDCTDADQIEKEFDDGTRAEDFVTFIGEKYDLDRIDLFPFTNTL
jgi:hypothetical protein